MRGLVAIVTAALVLAPPWRPSYFIPREAIRIVDGDTIDLYGERWRLLGFDAAEVANAKCAKELALGRAAAARLGALLAAASAIEHWPDAARREKWGRRLSHLTVDGRDVGAILIREGLARPYEGGRRAGWCD